MRPFALITGLVFAAASLAGVRPAHSPSPPARAAAATVTDWPAYHGNRARSGYYAGMPAPTGSPRVVASIRLDAAAYASPLVVNHRIIVATENDSLYGISTSGVLLWQRKLGTPARLSQLPCGNIDPSGITGTPVYYAGTGLAYVVVEHGNPVRHAVAAFDPRTGAVRWTRQLTLAGTAQNAMQQRGALTVVGGRVWIPFGGRAGDCGNYKGRLIGLPLSGRGAAVAYTVPTAREGGMWTPPGPSVDSVNRIYVAVGNGAAGPGAPYDHSDSILKFDVSGHLLSFFAPSGWAGENAADLDLGTQGPAIVGSYIYANGKTGTAYTLRRSNLGGIGGQVSARSVCVSFGGTAVYTNVVYVPCDDGLRAVRISSTGQMQVLWHTSASITGSPVVGGGRVWALNTGTGVLHGLNPDTGASVESVSVGAVTRFTTPAIYGSRIFVGTRSGVVIVQP